MKKLSRESACACFRTTLQCHHLSLVRPNIVGVTPFWNYHKPLAWLQQQATLFHRYSKGGRRFLTEPRLRQRNPNNN